MNALFRQKVSKCTVHKKVSFPEAKSLEYLREIYEILLKIQCLHKHF